MNVIFLNRYIETNLDLKVLMLTTTLNIESNSGHHLEKKIVWQIVHVYAYSFISI